jgi:hypothetical protein
MWDWFLSNWIYKNKKKNILEVVLELKKGTPKKLLELGV